VERRKWSIREGIPGPAGEPGFLLVAPASEALDWDIEHEIASTSRFWMSKHQAWWIAASYLETVRAIVARFDSRPEPAWVRMARLHLPAHVSGWMLGRLEMGGFLPGSVDRA
jgi:hypothetical protein